LAGDVLFKTVKKSLEAVVNAVMKFAEVFVTILTSPYIFFLLVPHQFVNLHLTTQVVCEKEQDADVDPVFCGMMWSALENHEKMTLSNRKCIVNQVSLHLDLDLSTASLSACSFLAFLVQMRYGLH